ncbi:MAG: U32 family peptidase, partial [Christensenellaceae bacterium]|nr:U32 family peptidase [Christensenellaceae bacterium]
MELLAPAGTFEKLKTAFHFGADAVYVGGESFSLRANAGNFTLEDIVNGVEYAHKRRKKLFVAANIFARNSDIQGLKQYFKELEKAAVDGVIISDLGALMLCREVSPSLNIHISTQAHTLNY